MNKTFTRGIIAVACILSAACGGGGGGDAEPGAVAPAPSSPAVATPGSGGTAGTAPARIPTELLPAGPAVISSNTYTCANVRLGAVLADTVFVPDGATCALAGTRLTGSVLVGRGAFLDATDVRVTGDVQSQGAQDVSIAGASTVGGSIQLEEVAAATLRGIGVTGNLQLFQNRGPIVVEGNAVGGSLQANQNTGGLRIESNRINGNLECQANLPAPAGGGNTAALKTGQCSVL